MDEYIERKALPQKKERGFFGDDFNAGWNACLNNIESIPAADVQPVRHGRWVETTQPMGWDDVTCAECSECGEDFVLDEWGMEDVKNLMHYCPNCGAKMDGGKT